MRRLIAWSLIAAGIAVTPPRIFAQEAAERQFTILIANDDGSGAPGLIALVDSLSSIAEVFVAAPSEQQSGTGHGITYRDPITVREVPNDLGVPWYAVGARPATTVRLALTTLLDAPPDLVVSGINSGANIGLDTWVSGTVAAAREAAFHGVPAIAVSRGGNADYAAIAGFVLIEKVAPAGHWVGRAAGLALLGWGGWMAAGAPK